MVSVKQKGAPSSTPATAKEVAPKKTGKINNAVPQQKQQQPRESLVVAKTVGGRITDYSIEFTKDAKYVFVCVGTSIKIYSVSTGAAVKVLSKSPATKGHAAQVTRVHVNPRNPLQLYSASMDGTIKLWDYNDDVLLKTIRVDKPIEDMMIAPENPDYAYISVQSPEGLAGSKDQSEIYRYYVGSDDVPHEKRSQRIGSIHKFKALDVSAEGRFLAVAGIKEVKVWHLETLDVKPEECLYRLPFPEPSVVRFNPAGTCFAVGDKSGKITLHHFTPDMKKPRTTVHHWHSYRVAALQFMTDGLYMVSGGTEGTLVFWQLETGHRQFLPRLGSEITSITISPDYKYYCVGLADNSIRFINFISQKIEQAIQGVQIDPLITSGTKSLATGLVVEPRNHHIVMNGDRSGIQFYNCYSDAHTADVEVVPNTQVRRSGEKLHKLPEVEHVAFLSNGEWMATVDMRDDKATTRELHLKFWQWNPDAQAYTLHTRVDKPHSEPITSLTFNPSTRNGPMAITTSRDKTFKVWHLTSQLGKAYQEGEVAWTCRSVGMYRQSAPSSAAFSADGSILAVAFKSIITLWDPYVNSIRRILTQPSPERVESVHFAGDSPYLVTVSERYLTVWNMLTCTVWWSYKLFVNHIATDIYSSRFAITSDDRVAQKSLVVTFDAKSAVPLAMHKTDDVCIGLAYLPTSESNTSTSAASTATVASKPQSDLLYLTRKASFRLLSSKPPAKEAVKQPSQLPAATDKRLLDDMFGGRDQLRSEQEQEDRDRAQAAAKLRQQAMQRESSSGARVDEFDSVSILGAPSHVLPGVEAVFETFMNSFMELRVDNEAGHEVDERGTGMEVDDSEDTTKTEDDEEMDIHETQALSDVPSLSAYFASISKVKEPHSVGSGTHEAASPSSSSEDDDSDEEDPADIDW